MLEAEREVLSNTCLSAIEILSPDVGRAKDILVGDSNSFLRNCHLASSGRGRGCWSAEAERGAIAAVLCLALRAPDSGISGSKDAAKSSETQIMNTVHLIANRLD